MSEFGLDYTLTGSFRFTKTKWSKLSGRAAIILMPRTIQQIPMSTDLICFTNNRLTACRLFYRLQSLFSVCADHLQGCFHADEEQMKNRSAHHMWSLQSLQAVFSARIHQFETTSLNFAGRIILLSFPKGFFKDNIIRGTSETIARTLKPYNIRVAHKPITTLRRLLTNVQDKDKPEDRQGAVYKVKCRDSQATYIGEPGRNLSIRLT